MNDGDDDDEYEAFTPSTQVLQETYEERLSKVIDEIEQVKHIDLVGILTKEVGKVLDGVVELRQQLLDEIDLSLGALVERLHLGEERHRLGLLQQTIELTERLAQLGQLRLDLIEAH